MPFTFTPTELPEVIYAVPRQFKDDRGYFLESYKRSEFVAAGIDVAFVQDNQSYSTGGVVRGLHYQNPPHAQGKLVQCLAGEILDVAVDIRVGSPTYGQWVSRRLSAERRDLLWVPPGFAHGFSVLTESAQVQYKVTSEYCQPAEGGIRWDDPALAIDWLIRDAALSAKDAVLPSMADASNGFTYAE